MAERVKRRGGNRREQRRQNAHRSERGGIKPVERISLAIVSLGFVAVFAATYSYADLRRVKRTERVGVEAPPDTAPGGLAPVRTTTAAVPTTRQPVNFDGETRADTFTICHTGGGVNCVVDGDTAWISGIKVRIADIDAPETHPPRCDEEANLGARATKRLAELMNVGPFEVVLNGPAEDRYGRQLRVLVRDGHSLGMQLVEEGLARPWEGARRPWC